MTATTARPAERRKGARRARQRLSRLALAALVWSALAVLVLVAGAPEEVTTPLPGPSAAEVATLDTVPRHAPVFVTSDWRHRPVRVAAVPPPATAVKPATRPRLFAMNGVHRPFAEMKGVGSPLIMPRLRLPRTLSREVSALRGLRTRAKPGEPVHVVMSAYCLSGTTRSGTRVRTGIVAGDPRVFPLGRRIELFAGGRYLGRFRVEDTGSKIKGTRIDIWTPSCDDARRFGMREGVAALVALGSE